MAVSQNRSVTVESQAMTSLFKTYRLITVGLALGLGAISVSDATTPLTTPQVLASASDDDWRSPRAEDLLIMQLQSSQNSGQIIIELSPDFAPQHVANILKLVNSGWFDGLSVNRVQDNFVAQWGDPDNQKSLGEAAPNLSPEFVRPVGQDLEWRILPDGDVFAAEVGWVKGFPAARDVASGVAWLAHCYGTVGVGRDSAADSGNGAELYTVIGHAPRQLDRNITVVGRVLQGMDILASLPRGTGPLGFYEEPEERIRIVSITQVSRLPMAERPRIQVMDTTRPIFEQFVESRRNRRDEWYIRPAGRIDLCSVVPPVRLSAP